MDWFFEKVHRVIKCIQEDCLKPYIDMNTKLKQDAKNNFEKDFFKLINNAVFEKIWKMRENIEISNLSQQKQDETIQYQSQTIILQNYSQIIY